MDRGLGGHGDGGCRHHFTDQHLRAPFLVADSAHRGPRGYDRDLGPRRQGETVLPTRRPRVCADGDDARPSVHEEGTMELTGREWWGLIHGMVLGSLFLLAFAGGLAELHALRPVTETGAGLRRSARRLGLGVTTMAVAAWATALFVVAFASAAVAGAFGALITKSAPVH